MSRIELLTQAFEANTRIVMEGYGSVRFECESRGQLFLPTGAIVTCDPACLDYFIPFDRTVQAGSYGFDISLGYCEEGDMKGTQFVAGARLRFSDQKIVQWVRAEKQEPSKTLGDSPNTGCACFMDVATSQVLADKERADPSLLGTIIPTFSKIHSLGNDKNHQLAIFAVGDGGNAPEAGPPCYWGLDEAELPVSLVCDCQSWEAE